MLKLQKIVKVDRWQKQIVKWAQEAEYGKVKEIEQTVWRKQAATGCSRVLPWRDRSDCEVYWLRCSQWNQKTP